MAMKGTNWTVIGIVIAAILVVGLVGYFAFSNSSQPSAVVPAANTPASSGAAASSNQTSGNVQSLTYNVGISNMAFSPPSLVIKQGGKVIWTNYDEGINHIVVSDSGSELSSGKLLRGQSYVHIFNNQGIFEYHCSVHPSMKGTIIVQ